MNISKSKLEDLIREETTKVLEERCQKGYKTHPTQKTKTMFGKQYRNCIKAEDLNLTEEELEEIIRQETEAALEEKRKLTK